MKTDLFWNDRVWRVLTNVWTLVYFSALISDFYFRNRYEFIFAPLSVIYIGILGIYVGTKEFDRWYEHHSGRHPGELFVYVWTALVGGLLGMELLYRGEYELSSEVIAVYIAVLSIFAFTQKSKQLYRRSHGRARLARIGKKK